MQSPIFVVGVGRSGTSLVQSILAANSAVVFPPETSMLRRLVFSGDLDRIRDKSGLQAVFDHLGADDLLPRLGQVLESLPMSDDIGYGTGVDIYKALGRAYLAEREGLVFGDKDPRLIEYLFPLRQYFPDARIVHVLRDPRDVLASKAKAAWSRARSNTRHVAIGAGQLAFGRLHGPRLFANNYCEIIYEALIDKPETEIPRLCGKLAIGFEPEMLDFQKAAKELVSEQEMSWKAETLGPMLKNNSGNWRSLDPKDVRLAEVAFAGQMTELGYHADSSIRLAGAPAMRAKALGVCVRLAAFAFSRLNLLRPRPNA